MNKLHEALMIVFVMLSQPLHSQCLSAVNPVGGSYNLLVQEKKSLRIVTFYRHNYGDQYFEKNDHSDFSLIESAKYNYAGTLLGYGLTNGITIESEFGYFIDKTQEYRVEPHYSLRGSGFSTSLLSLKGSLLKNNEKRVFLSASMGTKIPFSRKPLVNNGVELPVEMQPTLGAFGIVEQLFFVKEFSATGTRYFITARVESNFRNKQEYRQGTSVYTSLFYSKHLMFPWLKGDWTAIIQLRNEWRDRDKTAVGWKESSGSSVFYFSPQLNYYFHEKWNISAIVDIPVYQYFNGIQLATKYGLSLNLARDFKL